MRHDVIEDVVSLVRPGSVHRRLYDDPAIFELELERIFGSAWIYVGHESQVKDPGDYFCTYLGRKPVVVVRGPDEKLHVLHNQCAHRGALVVALEKGRTDEFQCCYHGWTYHLDGRLKAVPLQHGYPAGFDPKSPSMAMLHVPRVSSYRGFIFANQSAEGPSLEDCLGYMTTSLDDMVDRAPDGELEIAGGVFKHTYNGNWKLYLENLCDAAHPWFTHRSSIDAAQQQSDEVFTDGAGEIAIRQMRQNGALLTASGNRRSGFGPTPTATAILATITTTRSWSPRSTIHSSAITRTRWKGKRVKTRRSGSWKSAAGTATSIRTFRS